MVTTTLRKSIVTLAVALFVSAGMAAAQTYDRIQRARAQSMLDQVRDEIKKRYYDPTFHGMDIDAHFARANQEMKEAATYNQAISIIANAVIALDDSHTFFDPPTRSSAVDYGWRERMIGDDCFVTAVRPGSDAEAKGIKPGDRVIAIEGYTPARDNLWKIHYSFYILHRTATVRVTLQTAGEEPRTLDVAAKIKPFPRRLDVSTPQAVIDVLAELENGVLTQRFREKNGVVVWKMSTFELPEQDVEDLMRWKVQGAKALVLDLRGNGGGYADTVTRLIGHFFDHNVKVADLRERRRTETQMARKPRTPFHGKVIVIVDSESASASEIFARVMQLEKRATVVGDRTAGAVMQSEMFVGKMGVETLVLFTLSISKADVIMADGQTLEKIGVTPDEWVRPTPADLAAGRDPVLARAIQLAGEHITAEGAARLFPLEWPR